VWGQTNATGLFLGKQPEEDPLSIGDGEDSARDTWQAMTSAERVDCIYRELAAVSPYVRKSMLVYNCVATDYSERDPFTLQIQVRRVLWMTTNHHFFPIAQHLVDQHHPMAVIHRSELAGIPMRGIDADVVKVVVELVWEQFAKDPDRYPLYDEDGTRLGTSAITLALAEPLDLALAPVEPDVPDPSPKSPILIGNDQHAHLYVVKPAAAPPVSLPPPSSSLAQDRPKKE